MARNEKIEEILRAWWEFDHCEHNQKAQFLESFNRLLDTVIGESTLTREQVLDFLWGQYSDYKKSKRREEQLRIARAAGN